MSLGWLCTAAAKSACDTQEVIQSGKVCEVGLSALLPCDLSKLSAQTMSEQVPVSLLAMTDWWYRSLAYVVKSWGDFHPLKDYQGHAVPFGKFFVGQCLKDLGVIPKNITRLLVGYAAKLFDDEKQLLQRCQLSPAPERRAVSDIIERDLSC